MFFKPRRSSRKKSSRKNRRFSHLSIEALERREMFAGDLMVDAALLLSMSPTNNTPPAVVADWTNTLGGATFGDFSQSVANLLTDDVASTAETVYAELLRRNPRWAPRSPAACSALPVPMRPITCSSSPKME